MSRHLVAGAIVGWAVAFGLAVQLWGVSEATEPGMQYADPFLPCTYVACLFGVPLGALVAALSSGKRG